MTCALGPCLSQCNSNPAIAVDSGRHPEKVSADACTSFAVIAAYRARHRRRCRSLAGCAVPTGSTHLAGGPEPVEMRMTPTVLYVGQRTQVVVRSPGADSIAFQSENGLDRYWRADSVLTAWLTPDFGEPEPVARYAPTYERPGAGLPQEAGADLGLPAGPLPGVPPRDRRQAAGAERAGRGGHRRLELGLRPALDPRRQPDGAFAGRAQQRRVVAATGSGRPAAGTGGCRDSSARTTRGAWLDLSRVLKGGDDMSYGLAMHAGRDPQRLAGRRSGPPRRQPDRVSGRHRPQHHGEGHHRQHPVRDLHRRRGDAPDREHPALGQRQPDLDPPSGDHHRGEDLRLRRRRRSSPGGATRSSGSPRRSACSTTSRSTSASAATGSPGRTTTRPWTSGPPRPASFWEGSTRSPGKARSSARLARSLRAGRLKAERRQPRWPDESDQKATLLHADAGDQRAGPSGSHAWSLPADLREEAVRRMRAVALVYALAYFLAGPLLVLISRGTAPSLFSRPIFWLPALVHRGRAAGGLAAARRPSVSTPSSSTPASPSRCSAASASRRRSTTTSSPPSCTGLGVGDFGLSWVAVWVMLFTVVVPAPPRLALLTGALSLAADTGDVRRSATTSHCAPASLLLHARLPVPRRAAHGLRRLPGGLRAGGRGDQGAGDGQLPAGRAAGRGRHGRGVAGEAPDARPPGGDQAHPAGGARRQGSRPRRELLLRRFEREAQATALMRSAHTMELYDFGVADDGTFYYVMELLDGFDLDELVAAVRAGARRSGRSTCSARSAPRSARPTRPA